MGNWDAFLVRSGGLSSKLGRGREPVRTIADAIRIAAASTMTAPSAIAPETIRAYRETIYRVLGPAPFALQVDAHSPTLAAAHRVQGVACSAFVTACNPYSQRSDADLNAKRQAALSDWLTHREWAFEPAAGEHPSNAWPAEDSYLVYGIPLDEARALGERLEQNALLWSGADAIPRLILLR